MPNGYWATAETVRDALDSQGSEQYYRSALLYHEQSLGRFLGESGSGVNILPIKLSYTQKECKALAKTLTERPRISILGLLKKESLANR